MIAFQARYELQTRTSGGVFVLIIAVFAVYGFIKGLEQYKVAFAIIMVGFWYLLWCIIKDFSEK